MNVLLISSEVTPYAQSGGLADVASSLSIELNKAKVNTRVLLPYYKLTKDKSKWVKTDFSFDFELWGKKNSITLYEKSENGVVFHAIENTLFTKREGIYGKTSFSPYSDNFIRYYILNYVALNYEKITSYKVDIYHCNDWPCGLLPMMLKQNKIKAKSVFTIHNLGYQGKFPRANAAILKDFDSSLFEDQSYNSPINMLKCAIENADIVTTVSPTYAKEIQTKEFGCNLENLLTKRKKSLIGILNGIDTEVWNPKTDKLIPYNYDIKSLELKENNKKELEEKYFGNYSDLPLFGIISRLAQQKGIEELIQALPSILENLKCRVIVVGTGNTDYEDRLLNLDSKYTNLSVNIVFNSKLAHLVESGCDFFLMPSLYEPCGLNQMYSLTYGTLVIASKVGGLVDTIEDGNTGFIIDKVDSKEIYSVIEKSCKVFQDKETLNKMRIKAMSKDFSWRKNSKEYIKLYKKLESEL